MTSNFLLFGHTVDSPLGKIDKSTLSQQMLMELLIDKINNKEVIRGYPSGPKDISEWHGLTFNETNEVTEISWEFFDMDGSLCFEWLPSSVVKVDILKSLFSDVTLGGTIDLTAFPENMKTCVLSCSDYTGEICLTSLPTQLQVLDLSYNKLSGGIVLNRLPDTLQKLRLSSNNFSGSTDFSALPESLTELKISNNTKLSGDIRKVKGNIYEVYLTNVRWIE